jgi:hypothetical protein
MVDFVGQQLIPGKLEEQNVTVMAWRGWVTSG